jgi:ribosomal protein S18 acetylase RimI-like enzyme
METHQITYKVGIPETVKDTAIKLFHEAFGKKIALAVPEEEKQLKLISNSLQLDYAIGAFSNEQLIGIAGFNIPKGSFTGGKVGLFGLIALLGFFRGIKAAIILSLYERQPHPGELVMDGLSVHASARGQGIGSGLLKAIQAYATEQGYTSIRLDVIDTNPRAKKLYERTGFKVVKTENFPLLQKHLGFSGSSTMIYNIPK